MQKYHSTSSSSKPADSPENSGETCQGRKGIEIVVSPDLPSQFFRGRRPASHLLQDDLWSRRLAQVGALP
jgi:hypothetical protein